MPKLKIGEVGLFNQLPNNSYFDYTDDTSAFVRHKINEGTLKCCMKGRNTWNSDSLNIPWDKPNEEPHYIKRISAKQAKKLAKNG